jgi:hypothetical protein
MRSVSKILAWLATSVAGLFLLFSLRGVGAVDPDRYYHFSLSRLLAESAFPWSLKQWAQFEGIGWDRFFPDKEFLFHVVTGWLSRFGGDQAVLLGVLVIGASVLALLQFVLFGKLASRPWGLALGLGLLFASAPFVYRMSMLRPQVLAVLFFAVQLYGLLRGSRRVFLFGIFFFALSYHTHWLTLLMILAFLCLGLSDRSFRQIGREGLICLGVFAVALVLNPYFPSNVTTGLQHIWVALSATGSANKLSFGGELYPGLTTNWFNLNAVWVALTVVGFGFVYRDFRKDAAWMREVVFLGLLTLLLALSLRSPRAVEYLVPTGIFFFALLAPRMKRLELLLVFGAFCFQGAFASAQYFTWIPVAGERLKTVEKEVANLEKVVASLKGLPENPKVFNCEWDASPYLVYVDPKLRVIDVLDPSFLYFYDEALHSLRERFNSGLTADVEELISASKSDLVMCRGGAAVATLEQSPYFERVHDLETPLPQGARLYRRTAHPPEARLQARISSLKVASVSRDSSERPSLRATYEAAQLVPNAELRSTKNGFVDSSAAILAARTLSKEGEDPKRACLKIDYVFSDPTRLPKEASFLMLGGAQYLEIWQDSKLLFKTRVKDSMAHMTQYAIPFQGKASSVFEVYSCADVGASSSGAALNLMSSSEIKDTCQRKRWKDSDFDVERFGASFTNAPVLTCLGMKGVPLNH